MNSPKFEVGDIVRIKTSMGEYQRGDKFVILSSAAAPYIRVESLTSPPKEYNAFASDFELVTNQPATPPIITIPIPKSLETWAKHLQQLP